MDLAPILETQKAHERTFRAFLRSLCAPRTATLSQILTETDAALRRLDAGWLDIGLLERRLQAACRFFASIAPHPRIHGLANQPLVFFQATASAEDQAEHRARCAKEGFSFFREKFGDLPPQAHYLHVCTNWVGDMRGTWRGRDRLIPPLHPFTSYGLRRRSNATDWREKPMVVGFRLPRLPELLGVSRRTATDYLARVVVHDIGHSVLPSVDPEREKFHEVAMLMAMDARELARPDDPWDELIRSECTDPYFSLEADRWLSRCRQALKTPTPLQTFIMEQYRCWNASKKSRERRGTLWGIGPDMPLEQAMRRIDAVIASMKTDGFLLYEK